MLSLSILWAPLALAVEVADIRAAKNAIVPDGLLDGLTDQEARDLIAYLAARK